MTKIIVLIFVVGIALLALTTFLISIEMIPIAMLVNGTGSFLFGFYLRGELGNLPPLDEK